MIPVILVVVPTLSQTIERNIIVGLREVYPPEKAHLLCWLSGYLPPESDFEMQHAWPHEMAALMPVNAIVFYGGGVGYRSSKAILEQITAMYPDVPLVNMGSTLDQHPSVIIDNFSGMKALSTQIIVEQQARHIVYIDGPQDNEECHERFRAFQSAIDDSGQTIEVKVLHANLTANGGSEAIERYFESTEVVADAYVCANDLTAKGVIEALQRRNICVPKDTLVSGFDDFEYAATMTPSLSTVQYPAVLLGSTAAKLLQQLLAGQSVAQTSEIKAKAIFRESSGTQVNHDDLQVDERHTWRLIQQRDTNARRLTVTRLLHRRVKVEDVMQQAAAATKDLGISRMALFTAFDQNRVGEVEFKTGYGVTTEAGKRLPTEFYQCEEKSKLWVACPLILDQYQYGYLLTLTDEPVLDFSESIAPQITELLDSTRLQQQAEKMQEQITLNEKMAALGGLVSGVAHEVNTPVGTSLLAATHLGELIDELADVLENGKLSKSHLTDFITEAREASELISKNLLRAGDLIRNFKLVAVDQSSEILREIELSNYLNSILSSLNPKLKHSKVSLNLNFENDVMISTYPGALAQVITNLFMNAFIHAYDEGKIQGAINIDMWHDDHFAYIRVADNGPGVAPDIQQKIFEPFFTTNRGSGGSGLGLHIVYNLVTQKLKGAIKLESEHMPGASFLLEIPSDAESQSTTIN